MSKKKKNNRGVTFQSLFSAQTANVCVAVTKPQYIAHTCLVVFNDGNKKNTRAKTNVKTRDECLVTPVDVFRQFSYAFFPLIVLGARVKK